MRVSSWSCVYGAPEAAQRDSVELRRELSRAEAAERGTVERERRLLCGAVCGRLYSRTDEYGSHGA